MSIRSNFEKELESLHLDLLRMGNLVEQAIDNSLVALKEQDEVLAKSIIKNDKEISEIERGVEARALKLLLQQQPVAKDLRLISTALKVITDLERIGDHAADIAEISLMFKGQPFIMELDLILEMALIARDMVRQAIGAFVRRDLEQAKIVIARDDEVDNLFDQIKYELIDLVSSDKGNADQVIDLIMITKYLEKIADHAVSVAEWVEFYITGRHKHKQIL